MKTETLMEIAKEIIKNSYSSYSNFKVASVVLTENDKIFKGVNVENASFGLTICAERNAIFSAVTNGERKFKEIVIYSPDGMPYPCGACRQVMAEFFNKNTKIIVATANRQQTFLFEELLPFSFQYPD